MTTEGTVAAWIASPTHKANLVSKNYVETGIAIASSTDGTLYVVQYFASPAKKK